MRTVFYLRILLLAVASLILVACAGVTNQSTGTSSSPTGGITVDTQFQEPVRFNKPVMEGRCCSESTYPGHQHDALQKKVNTL